MDKKLFKKGRFIALIMSLFLIGCSESDTSSTTDSSGSSSSDSSSSSSNETIEISGSIRYQRVPFSSTEGAGLDYDNIEFASARGVTVEAINALTNEIVDSTATSAIGTYSVTVEKDIVARIRINAQTVSTDTAQWSVEVRDNTSNNGLYYIDGAATNSDTSSDAIRNYNIPTVWDGTAYTSRSGAVFALLDDAYDVIQKIVTVDSDVVIPDLDIYWSENNTTASGDTSLGEIGTSYYSNNEIYILGDATIDADEFDNHIVIHEIGHFIEDNLSRADSIGGSHSTGDILDIRVALGEGFGNAFSGMITDDPLYRDSYTDYDETTGLAEYKDFQIDVDENINTNPGWFSEGSIQAILYDLYDADVDSDGSDNVALGFAGIYEILTSSDYINQSSMTSIFSFIDEAKNLNSSVSSDIDILVAAQSVDTVADKYGEGETNDGGTATDLPIYKSITDDGVAVEVCSHNTNQAYNGLGVSQFVRFTPSAAGDFTITADALTGTGDPDFKLYLNGYVAEGIEGFAAGSGGSTEVDQEQIEVSLQDQEYILEIYDWENYIGSTSAGLKCYDVTLTNS